MFGDFQATGALALVGMASDVDLAVEGLPKLDLLEAMAEAESSAGGIPVDLVRIKSLQPHGSSGSANAAGACRDIRRFFQAEAG